MTTETTADLLAAIETHAANSQELLRQQEADPPAASAAAPPFGRVLDALTAADVVMRSIAATATAEAEDLGSEGLALLEAKAGRLEASMLGALTADPVMRDAFVLTIREIVEVDALRDWGTPLSPEIQSLLDARD